MHISRSHRLCPVPTSFLPFRLLFLWVQEGRRRDLVGLGAKRRRRAFRSLPGAQSTACIAAHRAEEKRADDCRFLDVAPLGERGGERLSRRVQVVRSARLWTGRMRVYPTCPKGNKVDYIYHVMRSSSSSQCGVISEHRRRIYSPFPPSPPSGTHAHFQEKICIRGGLSFVCHLLLSSERPLIFCKSSCNLQK